MMRNGLAEQSEIMTVSDIIDDLRYRMAPDQFKSFYDKLQSLNQENGADKR